MKIAFITEGNPNNPMQWSGTVCQAYRSLLKKHEIIDIDILTKHRIQNLLFRALEITARLFSKKYIRTFSLLKAKTDSRYVAKKLKQTKDIDLIFCPAKSGSIAYLNTNIPIVYLTDATFCQMVDYYAYLSNLCRLTVFEGNTVEKRALQNASVIISASNWAKDSMLNDYKIENDKIKVVPFGANLSASIKKVPHNDAFNILFCGVDWDRKGGQIAVDTARELTSRGFSVMLDLVGCMPKCEISEKYIKKHGFLSKSDNKELKQLEDIYAHADVLLLPTKAECAGIVFAEASGYSIPSVTFDTGGIESYVYNGVNGFRLPPGSCASDFADKLELLIKDKAIYDDLCNGARKLYEDRLNWNVWADSLENILEQIR